MEGARAGAREVSAVLLDRGGACMIACGTATNITSLSQSILGLVKLSSWNPDVAPRANGQTSGRRCRGRVDRETTAGRNHTPLALALACSAAAYGRVRSIDGRVRGWLVHVSLGARPLSFADWRICVPGR